MPGLYRDDLAGFIAIADAVIMLSVTRQDLLHRLRLTQVETLRYVPARGGWFIPAAVVDLLAVELGVRFRETS